MKVNTDGVGIITKKNKLLLRMHTGIPYQSANGLHEPDPYKCTWERYHIIVLITIVSKTQMEIRNPGFGLVEIWFLQPSGE